MNIPDFKITVYISIGNSDDKLSQAKWAEFYRGTSLAIRQVAAWVHGQWVSEPASAWQNACWCIELDTPGIVAHLKRRLGRLAHDYGQDSIAWAEAPTTAFLEPIEPAADPGGVAAREAPSNDLREAQ
jgi:hypothetical protein